MSPTKTKIGLWVSGLATLVLGLALVVEIAVLRGMIRQPEAVDEAALLAERIATDPELSPSVAMSSLLPGVSIALPAGKGMGVQWILPPSIDSRTNDVAWEMAVATNGVVWLKEDERRLLCPTRGVVWDLPKNILRLAVVHGRGVLLADGLSLLMPMAPSQPDDTTVVLQPIITLPVAPEHLFGVGDHLYFAGYNLDQYLHEVYRLSAEPDAAANAHGVRQLRRVFASLNSITAIAGNGQDLFVAQGREVIRCASDQQRQETLFCHPSAVVSSLAWAGDAGLFYATDSAVGYHGANGRLEFLHAPKPQIACEGGKLFVFVPEANRAVFAVTGLGAFPTLPLQGRVRPTTPGATLLETAFRATDANQSAVVGPLFPESIVRVEAALRLEPAPGHESLTGLVTVAWQGPDGDVLLSSSWRGAVADADQARFNLGYDEPGEFLPGQYRLVVRLNGQLIGTGEFGVGEVSPVVAAVQRRDLNALRRALENGGNPNEMIAKTTPVLHLAAEDNWVAGVSLLLSFRADVNGRNAQGETPLFRVPRYGTDEEACLETASVLLRHGADVDARTDVGVTPLHACADKYAPTRVIVRYAGLLLAQKANPNAQNRKGISVLHHHLLWHEKADIHHVLLENGARLLPNELNCLSNPNAQKVCGTVYLESVFESNDAVLLATTRCELPWLQTLIIRRLLGLARAAIPTATTPADYQRALAFCRQAQERAEAWQVTDQFPEIDLNIELLSRRVGR